MFAEIKPILEGFGFTHLHTMISTVCLLMFLGNFMGGLLASILVAFSGPQKPRKMYDKISFRLCLSSELFLVIFATYYHLWLIEDIQLPHIVYWVSTLLISPLLAYIGAQITYIVYQKKIQANEDAYRRWAYARMKKMQEKQMEENAAMAQAEIEDAVKGGVKKKRRPKAAPAH